MKSVGAADYVRLYQSAMQDLDAAVQLDPNNIETFNARGLTYVEHSWTATENGFESGDTVETLLARAKADFTALPFLAYPRAPPSAVDFNKSWGQPEAQHPKSSAINKVSAD